MTFDRYHYELDRLDRLQKRVLNSAIKNKDKILRKIENAVVYCDEALIESGDYPRGP
jgi:aminopeptidase-like protein